MSKRWRIANSMNPRQVQRTVDYTLLLVLWVLVTSRDAYAYVDPGTGSIILQVLLGMILAASIWWRRFWRNPRATLRKLFQHGKTRNEDK
jgi:O-antigen/teichoic acid export membrane protein